MKIYIAAFALAAICAGCEQKVEPASSGQPTTVEKNTTVVAPPAEEKKSETNTTVVNPAPAAPAKPYLSELRGLMRSPKESAIRCGNPRVDSAATVGLMGSLVFSKGEPSPDSPFFLYPEE